MKTTGQIIAAIITLFLLAETGFAGEWEKSFDLSLNATQASYSNNWTGGEAGNFSWVWNANGIFNKQLSPGFQLKNTFKLAFGQTHTQLEDENGDEYWAKPKKSTDKIDLESVGLIDFNAFVEPFIAFRFESQFYDASVDTNKRYINPILLTESVGIAKQLLKKDKDDILTRLGLAIKHNINRDLQETGLDKFETVTATDGGIESNTDVKLVFNDKLSYIGKVTVYKALFFSDKDKVEGTESEDYWKAIDINWENSVTASIAKYVQVVFYTQLLYDKQISLKGRLKETLALGLTYKMF